MKCCICGKEIKGSGHNPSPFIGAKCCDKCNGELVVPLRLVLNDRKTAIVIAPEVIPGFITLVNEEGLLKGMPFNTTFNILFGESYVGTVALIPKDIFEAPED